MPPQTQHHLEKSLRIDRGEVTYTDGAGLFGSGSYDAGSVARGDERTISPPPPVTVAVTPPHSKDRARFLVEKLGELAVTRLIWLETAHAQGRPPRPDKSAAWVSAALEQSRGSWLMEIVGPLQISDAVGYGTCLFADADGQAPAEMDSVDSPVLMVGPEGGFAPGEIPGDAIRISLGPTILRVETAAIVGAGLLRNAAQP